MHQSFFLEFQTSLTELYLKEEGGSEISEFSASGRASRALYTWTQCVIAPFAFLWYLLVSFIEFGKNQARRTPVSATETFICRECCQTITLPPPSDHDQKCPHCDAAIVVVNERIDEQA